VSPAEESSPAALEKARWVFAQALRDLGALLGPMVSFFILFRLLLFGLLAPFWSDLLAWVQSRGGLPALGNTAIVAFLLTPQGWIFVLLLLVGVLLTFWVERAGFLVIAERRERGVATNGVQALWLAVRAIPRTFGTALLVVIAVVAVTVPFLALVGWVAGDLLGRHDINYFLREHPPEFIRAAVVVGLVLLAWAGVLVYLYTRWYFAVATTLVERRTPFSALRRSAALGGRMRRRILVIAASWLGFLFLAGLALVQAHQAFSLWYLGRLGGGMVNSLVGVLGLFVLFQLLAAIWYFFFGATDALLMAGLYRSALERREEERVAAPSMLHLEDAGWCGRLRSGAAPAALWTILVLVAGGILLFAPLHGSEAVVSSRVVICGHRGSSKYAPENTLSALRRAIEDGADMAEIDVQETRDGVVVLLHDTDLMRIARDPRKIWEIDLAELRELDVGSWFSEEFRGEKIATLEEAIAFVDGRMKLNIELKYTAHERDLPARVVEIVREAEFKDSCVITSLEYALLKEVEALAPELDTGFIVARSVGRLDRLDVDLLSVSRGILNLELLRRAGRVGMKVYVWTVNERSDMKDCLDLGVDGILTDEPALLREVLEDRARMSDAERLVSLFRRWVRS
jgi:glycerophosphoryl diester phosphodiesterase